MNNIELEQHIKEIIDMGNMFDMIIAAKNFDKDYKTSDFYKTTKMPLMEIIKDAKIFYFIDTSVIKDKLQNIINNIDMSHLNELFDQVGNIYAQENADTMQMLNGLSDFKDIIKNTNQDKD
jgi:uncharacterized protein YktA (UPF0223 family)